MHKLGLQSSIFGIIKMLDKKVKDFKIKIMPNTNKKVFVLAIFLIGILLLLVYLATNFSLTGEQHLHGGGFKEAETSINMEVGIMDPKEIEELEHREPDDEIKSEEETKEKVPPPTN